MLPRRGGGWLGRGWKPKVTPVNLVEVTHREHSWMRQGVHALSAKVGGGLHLESAALRTYRSDRGTPCRT